MTRTKLLHSKFDCNFFWIHWNEKKYMHAFCVPIYLSSNRKIGNIQEILWLSSFQLTELDALTSLTVTRTKLLHSKFDCNFLWIHWNEKNTCMHFACPFFCLLTAKLAIYRQVYKQKRVHIVGLKSKSANSTFEYLAVRLKYCLQPIMVAQ